MSSPAEYANIATRAVGHDRDNDDADAEHVAVVLARFPIMVLP
jgi:hypothetical protein